jgi:hypothetical protein
MSGGNPFTQFAPQPESRGLEFEVRPGAGGNPFTQFAPSSAPSQGIDFSRPIEEVRADIAKLPESQRAKALEQWSQAFVAKEREEGGIGYAASNAVRTLARGTPIGSFLDEAQSGTGALLNRVTGGRMGAPYDESQAYQKARDAAVDQANPIMSIAGQVGGAVASAPFLPVATVMRGAGLGSQMVNAGVTGLGYGATYGAGLGDSVSERAGNAAIGGAMGGGIGTVAPAVARGVGNATGYVADLLKGRPAAVQGFERGAVQRIGRGMSDDGISSMREYGQRARPLGPEGMIADLGDNLRDQAGAIANQPGQGQRILREGLDTRRTGASGRINQTTDAVLGPRQNLPKLEAAIRKNYGDAAKPLYDEFYRTPVPFSREVEGLFNRIKQATPGAISRAKSLIAADVDAKTADQFFAKLNPDGTIGEIRRVPNAMEWDYIKRAIDDTARGAGRGTNEERIFGGLAKSLRDTIDDAISPGAPAQSPWARARSVAGEGIGLREAVEEGQGAFSKGLSRDQMQADMGALTSMERQGYNIGARAQIDDTMRNSGTAFGPNGDTAARRLLGNENARDKLALVAGDDGADRLLGRLDAETAFEVTRQGVTQNSATARRQAAQAEFPSAVGAPLNTGGQSSFYGRAEQGVMKLANALLGGAINDKNARIAVDAAKMLSAQGVSRDQIAKALIEYQGSSAMTQQGKEAVSKLANMLMQSGRPAAIDAQSR